MRARRSGWRRVPEQRVRVVRRMIETGINTVMTSSCGRLFDAVAALIGLRYEVNFEGQAAIELEAIADPACEERYEFEIGGEELDFRPMMERIVQEEAPAPVVAARFHNTLAAAIHEMCLRMRRESGLERVCLSGGTFQNMRLLGSDGAGAARVGVRAVSASQRAAQRRRDRAGAGGDRGGTDEVRAAGRRSWKGRPFSKIYRESRPTDNNPSALSFFLRIE